MTELLREFVDQLGRLSVTMNALNDCRLTWVKSLGNSPTDEELSKREVEPDEPVLCVKISKTGESSLMSEKKEHGLEFVHKQTDQSTGQLSILELPEHEFYTFISFYKGIKNLQQNMPDFFHGMCLVYGYALLESYLTDLLTQILCVHPKALEGKKQIAYREITQAASMKKLLQRLIQKEVAEVFSHSCKDRLSTLRRRHGFKNLTTKYDKTLIECALIRNCLLHNKGLVDEKLAAIAKRKFKSGTRLHIDRNFVQIHIEGFKAFALQVDKIAEAKHLKDSKKYKAKWNPEDRGSPGAQNYTLKISQP
jgi:hypothetical protein